jgi:tRNA(fMet)-specific endonuclease VapC
MYLLDTDVLSDLIKPRPSTALLNRLVGIPLERQYTSAITLGELLYGVLIRGVQGERLREKIETEIIRNLTVLPFDDVAARAYARIRAELDMAGEPIGEPDTRIASIGVVNDLTLVTGNIRHFARVPGLRVVNWLAP